MFRVKNGLIQRFLNKTDIITKYLAALGVAIDLFYLKRTGMNSFNSEKLQKILARAGFGSRRSVEPLIAEGHVKVNGQIAKLGDRATPDDRIMV